MELEVWNCYMNAVGQFAEDGERGATLIRSKQIPLLYIKLSIYSLDFILEIVIDLIRDVREQRERVAKRDLKHAGQSAAKQRICAELSHRALADVAWPPLKDQPVNIPTSSTTRLSSTVNEPSVAATAPQQRNENWCTSVCELVQKRLQPVQRQHRRSHRCQIHRHLQRRQSQPGNEGANPVHPDWADHRARPESQNPLRAS